jgi:pimeloyl-ACP methyl ester carboxylesterase
MSARPEPIESVPLSVDGFSLRLDRYGPASSEHAVLLLHGASASSETFLVPNGGLVRHLSAHGYDVWTLDWRGSMLVVDKLPPLPDAAARNREYRLFTLDRVGAADIPLAVEAIGKSRRGSISLVAHCFGAGACAIAVAQRSVPNVHHVVLSTLGLFYEAPWDGWIKAEDFIIERVLASEPTCRAIDPRRPKAWPCDMRVAFDLYPPSWLPGTPVPNDDEHPDNILRRLTFMFGQPYPPELLSPGIHGRGLSGLFGSMHIGLYLHAGQMVRRGYAAPFDEPDVIDRLRLPACKELEAKLPEPAGPWPAPRSYLEPVPFRDKRITLITGAENRLWHRDSIDLMYDWLRNEAPPTSLGAGVTKHVFPGYAHQDLLWGRYAARDVYPAIAAGLPRVRSSVGS